MKLDLTAALDNPVITKELRGRMRGSRAHWLLLGYLLVLSIALFLAYLAWYNNQAQNATGSTTSFVAGRDFFNTLFYVQACLVCLITPALTSGAISIEREQRTFEMVRCTRLRPSMVVFGKVLSSVSFVVLLLTCSLPLVSVCFLLGGVSPGEVLSAYGMLVCDAALFGTVGIVWSTIAANTAAATALSYGTLSLYFFATIGPALMAMQPRFQAALSALNPVGAITCASTIERYFGWRTPAWGPGLIVNGMLTLLVALVAVNRLEDEPWRRSAPVRLVQYAFAAVVLFLVYGGISSVRAGMPISGTMDVAVIGVIGMIVIVVWGATLSTGDVSALGDIPPAELHIVANPITAIRELTPATGPLASLLLTAIVAAVTTWAVSVSVTTPVAPRFPFGSRPPVYSVSMAASGTAALHIGLICAAEGVAVAGLGLLFSVLIRNRWGAFLILCLLFIAAAAMPCFSYIQISLSDYARMPDQAAINWLYLSPLAAIIDAGSPSSIAVAPMLAAGPMWLVTPVIYVLIGIASLAASPAIYRRAYSRARTKQNAPASA